jgi:hypothetical protein
MNRFLVFFLLPFLVGCVTIPSLGVDVGLKQAETAFTEQELNRQINSQNALQEMKSQYSLGEIWQDIINAGFVIYVSKDFY